MTRELLQKVLNKWLDDADPARCEDLVYAAECEISNLAQQERKPEDSAETWHRRYMEATQQHNDRVAVLGGEIEALEADLQSYQGAWPAWHDAPTVPGLWASVASWGGTAAQVVSASEIRNHNFDSVDRRWYGPISKDSGENHEDK